MIISTERVKLEDGPDDVVDVFVDGRPLGGVAGVLDVSRFYNVQHECSDAQAIVALLRGLAQEGAITYQESPEVTAAFPSSL